MQQNPYFEIGDLSMFQHTAASPKERYIERAAHRDIKRLDRLSITISILGVVLVIVTIIVGGIITKSSPNLASFATAGIWTMGIFGALIVFMLIATDILGRMIRTAQRVQKDITAGMHRHLFVTSKHFSYAVGDDIISTNLIHHLDTLRSFFRHPGVQRADLVLWNKVELTPASIQQYYDLEMLVITIAYKVYGLGDQPRRMYVDDVKQRKTTRIAQIRTRIVLDRTEADDVLAELDRVEAALIVLERNE